MYNKEVLLALRCHQPNQYLGQLDPIPISTTQWHHPTSTTKYMASIQVLS